MATTRRGSGTLSPYSTASFRTASTWAIELIMWWRSKMARDSCPVSVIATSSETPARTRFRSRAAQVMHEPPPGRPPRGMPYSNRRSYELT